MGILINGLRDKEDALHPAAENALKAVNAIVTKEDGAPETQRAIVEQLLKLSGYIFDSVTGRSLVSLNSLPGSNALLYRVSILARR